MPGTASATDRLAAFTLRRTPDVAAPADSAAEETVPDTLSPTEDTALDAPAPPETAGARAFDSSQAVLLGRSLRAVLLARDRRRAGLALPMSPPVFWYLLASPFSQVQLPYPQTKALLTTLKAFLEIHASGTRCRAADPPGHAAEQWSKAGDESRGRTLPLPSEGSSTAGSAPLAGPARAPSR